MIQMLLKMQMQILMYYANALKDTNANLELMMQMRLKMQIQILIYDANALEDRVLQFVVQSIS